MLVGGYVGEAVREAIKLGSERKINLIASAMRWTKSYLLEVEGGMLCLMYIWRWWTCGGSVGPLMVAGVPMAVGRAGWVSGTP
jgi:hypothetical protein